MKILPELRLLALAGPVAAVLALATPVGAQTTWTGAIDNDWNTPGNWDNGLPSGTNQSTIAASGANVTMSAPGVATKLTVAGAGPVPPVLNITQDLKNDYWTFDVGAATADDQKGQVNHTAGTLTIGGSKGVRRLNIGGQVTTPGAGLQGIYNFGGADHPTLTVLGNVCIGTGVDSSGELNLSNSGVVSVDGAFSATRENSDVGTTSILSVVGGDLDITFGSMDLTQYDKGNFSLNAELTSSGFSTIKVTGGVAFGSGKPGGKNKNTFNLKLNGFTGTIGQKITIIDASDAFTGYGVFANAADGETISDGGYSFLATYDAENHDFILEVTAIP